MRILEQQRGQKSDTAFYSSIDRTFLFFFQRSNPTNRPIGKLDFSSIALRAHRRGLIKSIIKAQRIIRVRRVASTKKKLKRFRD